MKKIILYVLNISNVIFTFIYGLLRYCFNALNVFFKNNCATKNKYLFKKINCLVSLNKSPFKQILLIARKIKLYTIKLFGTIISITCVPSNFKKDFVIVKEVYIYNNIDFFNLNTERIGDSRTFLRTYFLKNFIVVALTTVLLFYLLKPILFKKLLIC